MSNHVVEVGKATSTDLSNGKTYNIVNQLLSDNKGEGNVVAIDSGYPTLGLLKELNGTHPLLRLRKETLNIFLLIILC